MDTDNHEDQSPETEAERAKRQGKVECYSTLLKGDQPAERFYWRARASNGKIVADSSEGYNTARARDDGLDAARSVLNAGQRVDL